MMCFGSVRIELENLIEEKSRPGKYLNLPGLLLRLYSFLNFPHKVPAKIICNLLKMCV